LQAITVVVIWPRLHNVTCYLYVFKTSWSCTLFTKRAHMKNSTRQYLYSVMRQANQEFQLFAKKLGATLLRTPLPKLLIIVLGAALLMSMIPLVLTLFVVFLLLKIILSLVLLALRGPVSSELQRVRRPYRQE
jgi:uncharacterized membrane protein YjgN (DUF898 family)